MKKVYICSPCRGDYENNIQRAREFSRAAVMQGCIPITPHIYLTQFVDDTIPAERELGLTIGRELVLMCDEPAAEAGKEGEKPEIGSVTLRLPAFKAMAVCNKHLDHGPLTVTLDGGIILDLAERLRMDPGTNIEIGG